MSALRSLKYFVWIIVPVVLIAIYTLWGLPHIAFNYTYVDDRRGYRPFAPDRYYLSCTYLGFYGHFNYETRDGTCPWFRFYKKQGERDA